MLDSFDPSDFEYDNDQNFKSINDSLKPLLSLADRLQKLINANDFEDPISDELQSIVFGIEEQKSLIELSIEQASYDAYSDIQSTFEKQKETFIKDFKEASEAINLLQKYDSALDSFFTINGRYFDYKIISEGVETLSFIADL